MNKILKTTKFVVDRAKRIKINKDKLRKFSKNFHHGDVKHWLSESPFDYSKLNEDEILNF